MPKETLWLHLDSNLKSVCMFVMDLSLFFSLKLPDGKARNFNIHIDRVSISVQILSVKKKIDEQKAILMEE